jgi:hypothetical protein
MNKRSFLRTVLLGSVSTFLAIKNGYSGEPTQQIFKGPFGSCCKDLSDAMKIPPKSFFFVEKNNVFYLTVGYAPTESGPGWFDQAVIYCPFCGKQLQEIGKKSRS